MFECILMGIFVFFPSCSSPTSCRQALLAQRGVGSDSDKLNPTHVTSSRALHHFDQRRADMCGDDDDKLLDVVGPPQSPLLPHMSK